MPRCSLPPTGQPVSPADHRLGRLKTAAAALQRGRRHIAIDALNGFPALPDAGATERLFKADALLRAGMAAPLVLQKILPATEFPPAPGWRKQGDDGNPYHRPAGSPAGGEFCSADQAGAKNGPAADSPQPAASPPAVALQVKPEHWTSDKQQADDKAYPPKALMLNDGSTVTGAYSENGVVQIPRDVSLADNIALGKRLGAEGVAPNREKQERDVR